MVILIVFAACDHSDVENMESEERDSPVEPFLPKISENRSSKSVSIPGIGYRFKKPHPVGVYVDKQGAAEPIRIAVADATVIETELVLYATKTLESGVENRGLWTTWDDLEERVGQPEEGQYLLLLVFPNGDGSRAYKLDREKTYTHEAKDPNGEPGVHIHVTITDESMDLPKVRFEAL